LRPPTNFHPRGTGRPEARPDPTGTILRDVSLYATI
jgi:hypothetical protein